jgi:CRP/FNR family transcriptional regulator, anaerobic regulatory protein
MPALPCPSLPLVDLAGPDTDTGTATVLADNPVLAALAPRQRNTLLRDSRLLNLAAPGQTLEPLSGWPVVLTGQAQLISAGPVPRVIEHLRPGQSSATAAAALLDDTAAPLQLEALLPTRLLLIGPAAFAAAMNHPAFARAVYQLLARRMNAWLLEPTPVRSAPRLSARLATLLLREGTVLEDTQQALAEELGTARECVSRQLRRFARAGWVRVRRERIEPLDTLALAQVAAGRLAPPA